MTNFPDGSTIVLSLGFLSGCVLGAFQTSKVEIAKRGVLQPRLNLFQMLSVRESIATFLNAILILFSLAILPIALSIGVLKLLGIFESHDLGQSSSKLYIIAWTGGVFTARFVRYLHWRAK